MKRKYIKPVIETVAVVMETSLLAGSDPNSVLGNYEDQEDFTPLSKDHKFDLWDTEED